jgi:hypothetical protein
VEPDLHALRSVDVEELGHHVVDVDQTIARLRRRPRGARDPILDLTVTDSSDLPNLGDRNAGLPNGRDEGGIGKSSLGDVHGHTVTPSIT